MFLFLLSKLSFKLMKVACILGNNILSHYRAGPQCPCSVLCASRFLTLFPVLGVVYRTALSWYGWLLTPSCNLESVSLLLHSLCSGSPGESSRVICGELCCLSGVGRGAQQLKFRHFLQKWCLGKGGTCNIWDAAHGLSLPCWCTALLL